MKQHIGHLIPLSEASRTWNKTWYTADEVTDLARRGVPVLRDILFTMDWTHYSALEGRVRSYITELEQIVVVAQ